MFTIRKSGLDLHRPGPAFDHLLDHILTGGYGLIVVDTLRRVSGSADGNSSEMGLVVDNLDRIKHASADGSVLAVAHTDKGDNDTRGYSGIEDDADYVWSAKGKDMFLTLALTKMKDGPDGSTVQLEATRTRDSLTLRCVIGRTEVTTNASQVRIIGTLRENFPNGVVGPELCAAVGLANSTFYRALQTLQETGHIIKTGTKLNAYYQLPTLRSGTDDSTLAESRGHEATNCASHPSWDHHSHGIPTAHNPFDLHSLSNPALSPVLSQLGPTGLTTLRSESTENKTESLGERCASPKSTE